MPLAQVTTQPSDLYYPPSLDLADLLLYAVVGLSKAASQAPCLGLGLIRSVQQTTLFLLTPLPPEQLSAVTTFQVNVRVIV